MHKRLRKQRSSLRKCEDPNPMPSQNPTNPNPMPSQNPANPKVRTRGIRVRACMITDDRIMMFARLALAVVE